MTRPAFVESESFQALLASEYPLRRPQNSFRIINGLADIRNHFIPDRHEQLNESATLVLTLCDGEHSIIDIWHAMMEEFDVEDRHEALSSIVRLVRYLQRTYVVFPCTVRHEQTFDPAVPVDGKEASVRIV